MEMEQTEKEAIRAASAEVSREFKTLINADDLDSLKQSQHLILGRLQDSNAVLSHFNEYSEHCFSEVSGDFSRNTRLLRSMKSDLDYIFQKLRSMKSRILATYPDAFPDDSTGEVVDRRPDLEIPHWRELQRLDKEISDNQRIDEEMADIEVGRVSFDAELEVLGLNLAIELLGMNVWWKIYVHVHFLQSLVPFEHLLT
ncbi:hypothetical protein SO802_006952 [Lithocarpus litseifolius]|uniref:KxDL domain-containing protein n=1 Tax=Lithocarpus litseifolius TaxID=425828 RepID=A0AAW2DQS0_9ROSI